MRRSIFAGILLAAFASGCLPDAGRTVLAIDAAGAVAGLIFLDRNGDAEFTPSTDLAAKGVSFAVVRGQRDTVATGTTDDSGVAVVTMVPVGSYRLVLDEVQLGDTLEAAASAPSALVQPNDTAAIFVALQYPPRSVRDARATTMGKLVAIEGVALNGWTTFGDSSVHIADSTGAVRAVRVRASPVAAGDSVRAVGRAGQVLGDPVLTDANVFVIAAGTEPVHAPVSTLQASTAREGSLAAALVRVEDARVIDSRQLSTGDVRVYADDGSGLLEILLDRDAGITSEDPVIPGARVSASGVLVPIAGGKWQLKPRSTADFDASVLTATIGEVRTLEQGQVVAIEGVALNGWSTFGDGTVHVADSTGSLRVFQSATAFVVAGDSVRFVGLTDVCCGQPVLSSLGVFDLGRAAAAPVPAAVSTGDAATAAAGGLDAALVVVAGTVEMVQVVASNTHLLIDDGSGELTVVLDVDTGISGTSFTVGDRLEVRGLLVPVDATLWLLKPRRSADLIRD